MLYEVITSKENLLKKAKLELPEAFLKRWLFAINEGKFTAEEIDKDFESFREDLKWQLIKDHLMKSNELESISTEVPVFKKYLEISDRLVSSQHADLYVGRKLPAYCQGLKVLSASSDVHPVSDSLAASCVITSYSIHYTKLYEAVRMY